MLQAGGVGGCLGSFWADSARAARLGVTCDSASVRAARWRGQSGRAARLSRVTRHFVSRVIHPGGQVGGCSG